jgi:putative ABC transport system permease protein
MVAASHSRWRRRSSAAAWQWGGLMIGRPDGVLVSTETVKDFQLRPGDLIKLRLQDANTQQLKEVPFHYLGIASEFPTAPRDSFFVANADYITSQTGSDAIGAFLIDTNGVSPAAVAARVRAAVGVGPTVTDINTSRTIVASLSAKLA